MPAASAARPRVAAAQRRRLPPQPVPRRLLKTTTAGIHMHTRAWQAPHLHESFRWKMLLKLKQRTAPKAECRCRCSATCVGRGSRVLDSPFDRVPAPLAALAGALRAALWWVRLASSVCRTALARCRCRRRCCLWRAWTVLLHVLLPRSHRHTAALGCSCRRRRRRVCLLLPCWRASRHTAVA